LISTWKDETSGINAFEAAERGVPVILCEEARSPHASRDFLPPWAVISCEDNAPSLQAALSAVPAEWSTMRFRQRLATHMRESFSKEKYAKELLSIVDEASFIAPLQKLLDTLRHDSTWITIAEDVKPPAGPQTVAPPTLEELEALLQLL